jgi:hypothetical protein
MYGFPDSALVGTAKRLSKVGGRKRRTEIEPEDFWVLVYAVKRFRARRKAQKARAEFYKKNGYYRQ